jgi:hypothetical protein
MSNLFGLKTRGEMNAELKERRRVFRELGMLERETVNVESELLRYWFSIPSYSVSVKPSEPSRLRFVKELKDGVVYEKVDAYGRNVGRGCFNKTNLLKWLGRTTLFKPRENN